MKKSCTSRKSWNPVNPVKKQGTAIKHPSSDLTLPHDPSTATAHTRPGLEACEAASFRLTGSHHLSLRFRDGYVADLDFSSYGNEGGPLRRALCAPDFFAQAYLAYGILSWPNGYDITPETLRRYAEQGYVR